MASGACRHTKWASSSTALLQTLHLAKAARSMMVTAATPWGIPSRADPPPRGTGQEVHPCTSHPVLQDGPRILLPSMNGGAFGVEHMDRLSHAPILMSWTLVQPVLEIPGASVF